MKEIKSIIINNNDLSKNETIRKLYVTGDIGCVFSIYVTNEDNHYYNFETKSFTATTYRLLQQKLDSDGNFIKDITFPAITDDDKYDVWVYAESHFETKMSSLLSTSLLYKVPNYSLETNDNGSLKYPCSIYQYLDVTTTLSLLHTDADVVEPSNYTFVKPKSTKFVNIGTKVADDTPSNTVTLDWTITTNNADHTMNVLAQPLESHFYTTTTKQVNGAISSDYFPILDDVTNLKPGMLVTHKTVNVGEDDTLTAITHSIIKTVDPVAKQIGMSVAQSFEDNSVLTIRGYGFSVARYFYGAKITATDLKFALDTVTNGNTSNATDFNFRSQIKTEWSSGTSVDIDSTKGLKAGNTLEIAGLNQALTVASVTNADTFVASGTNATTIPVDTYVYATGSAFSATVTGTIKFLEVPTESFTLTLDLDKIITITDTY